LEIILKTSNTIFPGLNFKNHDCAFSDVFADGHPSKNAEMSSAESPRLTIYRKKLQKIIL